MVAVIEALEVAIIRIFHPEAIGIVEPMEVITAETLAITMEILEEAVGVAQVVEVGETQAIKMTILGEAAGRILATAEVAGEALAILMTTLEVVDGGTLETLAIPMMEDGEALAIPTTTPCSKKTLVAGAALQPTKTPDGAPTQTPMKLQAGNHLSAHQSPLFFIEFKIFEIEFF